MESALRCAHTVTWPLVCLCRCPAAPLLSILLLPAVPVDEAVAERPLPGLIRLMTALFFRAYTTAHVTSASATAPPTTPPATGPAMELPSDGWWTYRVPPGGAVDTSSADVSEGTIRDERAAVAVALSPSARVQLFQAAASCVKAPTAPELTGSASAAAMEAVMATASDGDTDGGS